MKYLSYKDVTALHELVIQPEELQGMAADRSLGSVLGRIDNRIQYGLIADVFALAACYASYLAIGHVFNDANKRTAFACMDTCLALNGIELEYHHKQMGDLMVRVAQGLVTDTDLAQWLRELYLSQHQAGL